MDKVQTLPTEVRAQIPPTIQAFLQLHKDPERRSILEATASKRQTHRYGPDIRQNLDVYHAQLDSSADYKPPILVFLYGGGLVSGSRVMPISDGLVYTNLGHYFATRGITVVIPDYRLVLPPARGDVPEGMAPKAEVGSAAVYPSGAVDVQLAYRWIVEHLGDVANISRIHLSGTSGGGSHCAAYVFNPDFFLKEDSEVRAKLRSLIMLSGPVDLEEAVEERWPVLEAYYGSDRAEVARRTTAGLIAALTEVQVAQLPPTLSLIGGLDPPDEVIRPNERFWPIWTAKGGRGKFDWLLESNGRKHNHISYFYALSSGEGEEWAAQIIEWIEQLA
ncbi:MAG: hypothetical protein CYPHOPRED_002768 [Cyphobasidiales sp. Tagirdzhanova-0007]|nr:MAG: hypothetical protein CYPHOPRED_002768 [Cyphobasidiales sp. Tagirdzhanova-0007]